jgi:hypothetical protein
MRVSPISRGPCRPLAARRSAAPRVCVPPPFSCVVSAVQPDARITPSNPPFPPTPAFCRLRALSWSPLPPCPAPLPTASISLIYRHPIGSALCTNPIGPPLRPSIPSDSSGQPRQIEGYNHPPPLFAASGIRSLCTVHWHRNSFLHSPSEPFSGSRPSFAEFSACLLDKL